MTGLKDEIEVYQWRQLKSPIYHHLPWEQGYNWSGN